MRVKLVVWYKIAVYIVYASRFYMYTYLVVIKVDHSVKLKIPIQFPTSCSGCMVVYHLLNTDDVKVILNEGMPHHKNPFDKGRLIINFKVGVDDHLHLHL